MKTSSRAGVGLIQVIIISLVIAFLGLVVINVTRNQQRTARAQFVKAFAWSATKRLRTILMDPANYFPSGVAEGSMGDPGSCVPNATTNCQLRAAVETELTTPSSASGLVVPGAKCVAGAACGFRVTITNGPVFTAASPARISVDYEGNEVPFKTLQIQMPAANFAGTTDTLCPPSRPLFTGYDSAVGNANCEAIAPCPPGWTVDPDKLAAGVNNLRDPSSYCSAFATAPDVAIPCPPDQIMQDMSWEAGLTAVPNCKNRIQP